MYLFFYRLRFRLILLVLLAVIPALGLTLYSGLEQCRHARFQALDDALEMAKNASSTQGQMIEATRQLLYTLAQLPQVRNRDSATCCSLFADLLKKNPQYLNIAAVEPNGNVFASAIPFTHPVNVADRAYFRRAIQTRNFAIGDYQIGRITGKPAVNFGYPVFREVGAVKAVVFVALGLAWINQLAAANQMHNEATLFVTDNNGMILACYPEPEKFVGKSMPETSIIKSILAKREGVEEAPDLENVPCLFGFTSLGPPSGAVYVSVGIPKKIAFAEADRTMIRNLTWLGLVTVLALVAAWFGGGLFIMRPVNQLLGVTKRLADGDLTARTGSLYSGGELDQLARAFDQMAESLELREAERKRTEEALRQAENKYRSIFENVAEGLFLTKPDGHYISVNPALVHIHGYESPEEMIASITDIQHQVYVDPDDRTEFRRLLEMHGYARRFETQFRRKDGSKIWVSMNARAVRGENGSLFYYEGTVEDITESKQAEESLRTSAREWHTTFDAINDAVALMDSEGRILKCNKAMANLLEKPFSEIIGRPCWELMHGTPDPIEDCPLVRIQETRRRETLLLPMGNRWFNVVADPLFDGDGNFIGAVHIISDITERKRAEDSLRESVEALRAFLNANPEVSFLMDAKGTVLVANESLFKRFSKSSEEIIGSCLYGLFPEDVTKQRKSHFDEVFRTGKPVHFEDVRMDRNYETFVHPVFDKEGNVAEVAILGFDITERKQTEEALRSSEEKYRTILENIEDGYYEVDIAGNFTFYNDSLCRILGYSRDEMIGMNDRQYTDQENAKKLFQAFNKVYRTGEPAREFDWEIIRKDGARRRIEASVSLIKDSSGNRIGFRGLVRDVTERKQIEQEKANLEEQLRQSQKIEAIGRLAGGIAHDFNNLLTVIKGYSQLSLIEIKEGHPLKENIEEIKKAAEKAADLTRQLLAFSRRQILDMKVLDLNTLLKDLDKMLRRVIGEDIELITLLTEDLGRVKVDPGQIEQVVMNLVVNARDAMPSGGKLFIETANIELDEAYARAHVAVTPGRFVMISVSDTGVGMTPEVRDRVFEPFFTTKEKGKGTGLGLSTVYGIVKQSGGNIWVYSEPGQGTTLKIYLPLVDEPIEELREKVRIEEIPRGHEIILIVEDDEAVRKLAVQILEKQGYNALQAHQGDEALKICQHHKDRIHLILTDVVMPEMSGRQLVDSLKQVRQDFKVLYTSGYTDNAIAHHGVLEKGVNFIQKPFTFEGLARKVREVLDK